MNNFCIITPDRGDRPEFLQHCKYQMNRQTLKPGKHYIIDYPPESDKVDIVPRVMLGFTYAILDQFEYVAIIENDDYYPDDYLETIMEAFKTSGADFVGLEQTIFYNIQFGEYKYMSHRGRASLFCTAFKTSALMGFHWPEKDMLYLDFYLWSNIKKKFLFTPATMPVGIKHGLGFCPGNGHDNRFKLVVHDPFYNWLQETVRPESFNFYMDLIKSINH